MTAVLKCDGCGALADDNEPAGWFQVRRLVEPDGDEQSARYAGLRFGPSTKLIGHCCSRECIANVALDQDADPPKWWQR